MLEILDYANESDRRRLDELTSADGCVLVHVRPYLHGQQFIVDSTGIRLSRELYDRLELRKFETFATAASTVDSLNDEELGVFSLDSAADVAQMLVHMLEDAAAENIPATEKQEIALDVFECLKDVIPFHDELDCTPAAAMREVMRRNAS